MQLSDFTFIFYEKGKFRIENAAPTEVLCKL